MFIGNPLHGHGLGALAALMAVATALPPPPGLPSLSVPVKLPSVALPSVTLPSVALPNVASLPVATAASKALPSATSSISSSPIVDLGYALHQASVVKQSGFKVTNAQQSNQSNSYYSFANIRYAAPPLGALRFAPPAAPLNNRSAGIQDGSYAKICPQSSPEWLTGSNIGADASNDESEDCLLLDVFVPQNVTNRADKSKLVPVIFWIHGGGYCFGSKLASGSPLGFLDRARDTPSGGAIYVLINYRLGAFGYLGGDKFASDAGTPNVGFYDQRAALNWVQTNIKLFGGDANKVTVMGESAGGSSIMHQITAYGGVKAPFSKAVIQSPAEFPLSNFNASNDGYARFLAAAGVSNVAQLRNLNSSALQAANRNANNGATAGQFIYFPQPDGTFVQDIASQALRNGKYDHSVKVIGAHNAHEGIIFVPQTLNRTSDFIPYVKEYFPVISDADLAYVNTTLYPADYSGKYGYSKPSERVAEFDGDVSVTCNIENIVRAFPSSAYYYQFSVPPGYHFIDVPYTFYDGPNPAVSNSTVAISMQKYLSTFADTGNPNVAGLPTWSTFSASSASQLNFGQTVINSIADNNLTLARCNWWQQHESFSYAK